MKPFAWAGALCAALLSMLAPAEPPATNSPPVVDYARLAWKDGRFYLDGRPFTGIAEQRHKNGALKCRYPFVNGGLHGCVEEWHPNGQKSTETQFADNLRHGTNTYWDTDGRMFKRQVWDRDRLVESTDPSELKPARTP